LNTIDDKMKMSFSYSCWDSLESVTQKYIKQKLSLSSWMPC